MKTNINLPQDDLCGCCDDECPNDLYNCEKLQYLINTKKVRYVWYWTLK